MTADKSLLEHALKEIPVPGDINLSHASDLGVVALLLRPDDDLTDRWYRALVQRGTPSELETFATLLVEREDVGIAIDARIESGDFRICDDLVRLGVGWAHDELVNGLDDDAHAFSVAWLMIETGDEAFESWFEATDSIEGVLTASRVMGMLGYDAFAEEIWTHRRDLGSDDAYSDARMALDAALAMMSPGAFSRGLLKGEVDPDWVNDPVLIADFIQATGPNSWLDVLAFLQATDDTTAFEFASLFAASAANASYFGDDGTLADTCETIIEPSKEWQTLSNRPEFGMVVALTDDEHLQRMLVETAASEYLLLAGGTPGIPGLPLSGSDIGDDAIERTLEMLETIAESEFHEDQIVAAVRLFCDLAYWARTEPDRVQELRPAAVAWVDEKLPPAIQAAARFAATSFGESIDASDWPTNLAALSDMNAPIDVLQTLADSEDICALAAVERLAWRGETAVPALAKLWRTGPVVRADVYREAAFYALSATPDRH